MLGPNIKVETSIRLQLLEHEKQNNNNEKIIENDHPSAVLVLSWKQIGLPVLHRL